MNDDDLPQLTLSDESVSVDEEATDTYTVVLAAQPTADVTVSLTSADPDAATVSPDTLTFTTTAWSTAKTVTVRGIDDDDGSEEAVEITHIATIDGVEYLLGSLFVSVSDDDTAPYFVEGATTTRSIIENSTPRTDVGPPVTALDPDGGALAYSLAGTDSDLFGIDSANGQIFLAEGVSLDYEAPADDDSDGNYEVTVSVRRQQRNGLGSRYHIDAERPGGNALDGLRLP